MQVECEICGKIMDKKDYPKYSYIQFEAKRFCSKQCKWKDKNYREIMEKAIEKSNANPSVKKIESAKRMGELNKDKHNSIDTEYKPGSFHPNWKGGTKKYRGEDWKTQRQKAIDRDNGICQRCELKGNDVHHIIPYSKSQSNNLDNLITLCKRCHIITERGYSKLIISGEDIFIKHVPIKTQKTFIELAENEFDGNRAMTLKWLMDDLINPDTKLIMEKVAELDSRIEALEQRKEKVPEEKTRKMLDGSEKRRSNE